jgi:hypothetical protein
MDAWQLRPSAICLLGVGEPLNRIGMQFALPAAVFYDSIPQYARTALLQF